MPARLLLDTGPLVAALNKREKYHQQIREFLSQNPARFFSTWPVITEIGHFVPPIGRQAVLGMVAAGLIEIVDITDDARRMLDLVKRYSDQDPDIADISLIIAAEKTGVSDVLTLDNRDFSIYRIGGRKRFNLVFQG